MEHNVSINITTEEHNVEVKETKFIVSEVSTPTGNVGHDHDDRYYTKAVIDEKFEEKLDKNTYIFGGTF
ncbi:MAG: hypothetical protein M9949_04645 [Candidatus Kapabacteria bacterium]|nr:hypothetical protein [Candidatus Kapabacteria bacterium]